MDYFSLSYLLLSFLFLPLLKTNRHLNPFIFYTWLSASWLAFCPVTTNYRLSVMVGLQSNAYFVMGLTLCFVLLMKVKIDKQNTTRYLAVIGIINIVLTIFLRFFSDTWAGLISNPGINQILNVALIPYIGSLGGVWLMAALVVNAYLIVVVKSSCAVAAFIALIFFGIIRDEVFTARTKAILISVLTGATIIAAYFLRDSLFNGYSRFDAYPIFFSDFRLLDYVFGKGAGSFYTLSIVIQALNNFTQDGFYIFMHSDPLQLLFEYGVLGIILITPAVVWFCRVASLGVFLSLAATVAGSLFYYPFHTPLFIAFIFLNIKLAYDRGLLLEPYAYRAGDWLYP